MVPFLNLFFLQTYYSQKQNDEAIFNFASCLIVFCIGIYLIYNRKKVYKNFAKRSSYGKSLDFRVYSLLILGFIAIVIKIGKFIYDYFS